MMKASNMVPKKFRSVRDRSASHSRNKSSDAGQKLRPTSTETIFSIFKPESAKQAQKEKEEGRENAKVDEIIQRLAERGLRNINSDHVRCALASCYAAADSDKAVELLHMQQQALSGHVEPYNPNVRMLGAENRAYVTCYLDSLLFAMFARLDAFDCMLKNDNGDENQRKLAALIRLWVNMLRTGKLIHTDMTQNLQEALANCGWSEAQDLEQQDTSEAFAFITESLQLPLLTLQVDLFHQGKGDKDDHKVVYERLLNLAVPPDPDGKGIKLEDCLEEYFNNRVDVSRDSEDEKKAPEAPVPILRPQNTIRIVTSDDDPESTTTEGVVGSPLQLETPATPQGAAAETSMSDQTPSDSHPSSPGLRHRSASLIQRLVVDDEGRVEEDSSSSTALLQRARRTRSTVVKAITIPAWQFFRLIPWHSTSNTKPNSNVEVARQFNQKPVVGICLKRYTITEKGLPARRNTFIDIPDSLRLPHFMLNENHIEEQEYPGLNTEYKLVLQSIICHRGDTLHSGHYISFARVAPKLLTDNRRHDHDPPPDYEEAQWAKFDDLADNRVSYVDDIKQSLKEEMPYLLFYQIVPMVDVTSTSTGSSVGPPSYDESAVRGPGSNTQPQTPILSTDHFCNISRSTSGYFDQNTAPGASTRTSIRFSSELEHPSRLSLDDGSYLKVNGSRRGSASVTDSAAATPAFTPDRHSPPGTPNDDSSTAARISRAAAKFTKANSKSRPTSQAGEGRISSTMSRLGVLMRSSKEPLVDGATDGAADGASGKTAEAEGPHSIHTEFSKEKERDSLSSPVEPRLKKERVWPKNKEKDRDKEKEKDKDKEKDKEKEKGKGKGKGKAKESKEKDGNEREDKDKEDKEVRRSRADVPERECIVM